VRQRPLAYTRAGEFVTRSIEMSCTGIFARRTRPRSAALAVAAVTACLFSLAVLQHAAHARVLTEADLERISSIKQLSTDVMTDITMISRRPDLSQTDGECIRSTLRSLTQIAGELQSYEYLITIESQLKDFDDDNSLRGVVRFAVDNALKILETERRRLADLSDQCARSPLSADKARQAKQFIESTQAILRSLQPRL